MADPKDKTPHQNPNVVRETIESIVVAFILAFLFRAFVAEAFVIPTGSMAPTLMGAHKDIRCESCGAQYQSTASLEFDNQNPGTLTDRVAIGSTCAHCRATNAFDLASNRNHVTFSGDRILVSKFDYLFRDPKRWDVFVFKFPNDAKLNYIKRLVGLPGEHLHIEGGDVFVRKSDAEPWQLARKPPHKALAMMQVVSDTQHQAQALVSKGWPSLWQPLAAPPQAPIHAWQVEQKEKAWSAQLPATAAHDQTHWLRYYHKYAVPEHWEQVEKGGTLADVNPYAINLITDFHAYNTTKFTSRGEVFDFVFANNRTRSRPTNRLKKEITSEQRALDLVSPHRIALDGIDTRLTQMASWESLAMDGVHWTGDLAAEFDVEVQSDTGKLSLDLVEFGIHYFCEIDLSNGKATIRAMEQSNPIPAFLDKNNTATTPTATTSMRGKGRHRLRYANIDDQLMLWINGGLVAFDVSTEFDSGKYRTSDQRRPYWTPNDPLDAAPIAIGGQGAALKVHRAQVWRDTYYIAIQGEGYCDYTHAALDRAIGSIEDPNLRQELQRYNSIDALRYVYASPELWANTKVFSVRNHREFRLEEGQFFPMGDNSAASSDARDWAGHHFVERRFLIGKALLVFWPHLWMAPVPHPNFARMGRIR